MRSLWDKAHGHEESPQAVGEGIKDLATSKESDAGLARRTTANVSPTASSATSAEARLVSQELLSRLRRYLRLRALVLGYLRVQARREWLGRQRTSLQRAGTEPDADFWDDLQGEFSGMRLRSEFPSPLLEGEDAVPLFVELVTEFDDSYASVAAAAEAALNPSQSAQSAKEALQHVSGMLKIARTIAEKCQEDAYTLLDELYVIVTEIFAGEGQAAAAEGRDKAIGQTGGDAKFPGAPRDDMSGPEKMPATGADVRSHLLTRPKGAT
jgi:hypothetical protein